MVNVAGRSKGCNTCRKRKVACDLEKPQCRRCLSSKIPCLGYERELVFVHDSRSLRTTNALISSEAASAKSNKAPEPPSQLIQRRALRGPTEDEEEQQAHEEYKQDVITTADSALTPVSSPKSGVPGWKAYRQQLLAEFLCGYLPTLPWTTYDHQRPLDAGPWLVLIPSLEDIPPALSYSLLALCTAFVGRRQGSQSLVRESLVFHGRALWALQKALWDPKTMYADETLAACLALCMYEASECPGKNDTAFATHVVGCSKLIQSRGPKAHSTALGHRLFLWFRTSGIIESFVHLRPTYLGEPAWTSTPWRDHTKGVLDNILDNAAVLANIFAKALTLNPSNLSRTLAVCLDVVDRCWKIESSLRGVYERLESECDGPLYWPVLALEMPKGSDPFSLVSLYFASLSEAYTCIMYWTVMLLLWTTLTHTYRVLGMPSVESFGLAAIESSFDLRGLTHKICQSIPYLLQDSMQGLGPAMAAAPLIAVGAVLENNPGFVKEVQWAKGTMQTLRRKGMRLFANDEPE